VVCCSGHAVTTKCKKQHQIDQWLICKKISVGTLMRIEAPSSDTPQAPRWGGGVPLPTGGGVWGAPEKF